MPNDVARSAIDKDHRQPAKPWNSQPVVIAGAMILALFVAPSESFGCPNADKLIEHMIDAHGGMGAWAGAPTVSFEDELKLGTAESGLVSRVLVEQGLRRATIDYPGSEMTVTWDGEAAWSTQWSLPYPPRFMALLNYHFLNLPWLTADPGVVLSEFGQRQLPNDPTDYFTVKVSYEEGVGDTPGDYYRLFVDPESHVLKAVQYIVTYQGLLPEGVTESPENTLLFTGHTEVGGLTVPTAYTIFAADGSVYASTEVRDWSFERPFDKDRMTMPEGAIVDKSTP